MQRLTINGQFSADENEKIQLCQPFQDEITRRSLRFQLYRDACETGIKP